MTNKNVTNAVITLSESIRVMLGEDGLNAENLTRIVTHIMKVASTMKGLKGEEKKKAVTMAVSQCIDVSDMAGPFEGLVLALVPALCDTLIDVEKGKLKINKRPCGGLFQCFTKKEEEKCPQS